MNTIARRSVALGATLVLVECGFGADALTPAKLGDVKILGHVAAVQQRFFDNRVLGDYARNEIWAEAHAAFAHPDDDVFQAPIGMWKGEYWGKLMLSAVRVAEYAHDENLKKFLHEEALRLIRYQRPDGYLGTYVNPDFVVPTGEKPVKGGAGTWNWNLWCRKYTMWGLLACYRMTGDKALLTAADRAMACQIATLRRLGLKLSETGTSTMRGLPPCSILKPLLWLYQDTGKAEYLDYAKEIYGYWSDPTTRAPQFAEKLASGLPIQDWYPRENGKWGKAYEMMSCLDGIVEYYRVTGDKGALDVAKGMQEAIARDELNLCLSVGYNDQFAGAVRHLNGVSEPCDAVHWMRLNHDLWLVTGEAKYADAIELTFYNAFLAAIRPDGKWGARVVRSHGRHQPAPPQSGMKKQHCCVNNLPRGFMDVAQTIAATDDAGALYVALYHDAQVRAGDAEVKISGNYPIQGDVKVSVERKGSGKVLFRIPSSCKSMVFCGGNSCVKADRTDWFSFDVPAGKTEWDIHFDMNPRIVDSRREAVATYEGNLPETGMPDYRRERWAGGGEKDLCPLLRKTPAAQVMWGPLLLAKSVNVGCVEAEILDPSTVNCGGWTLQLEPVSGVRKVWGGWKAVFEKDGRKRTVGVCDYSSAATWAGKGVEFSVFF